VRYSRQATGSYVTAGLKVRGLGRSAPQLLAKPPAQGDLGGRLREGLRKRGKRREGAPSFLKVL